MIRRPPRSTQSRSSAASDVYKRQRTHYVLCACSVIHPLGRNINEQQRQVNKKVHAARLPGARSLGELNVHAICRAGRFDTTAETRKQRTVVSMAASGSSRLPAGVLLLLLPAHRLHQVKTTKTSVAPLELLLLRLSSPPVPILLPPVRPPATCRTMGT